MEQLSENTEMWGAVSRWRRPEHEGLPNCWWVVDHFPLSSITRPGLEGVWNWKYTPGVNRNNSKRGSLWSEGWERGLAKGQRGWRKSQGAFFFLFPSFSILAPRQYYTGGSSDIVMITVTGEQAPKTKGREPFFFSSGAVTPRTWNGFHFFFLVSSGA